MAWQTEIDESGLNRADIARREGITRARVTQLMSLLDLPEAVKAMLLEEHAEVDGWSIRRAIEAARSPQ